MSPGSAAEVAKAVRAAHARGEVAPSMDLRSMNRIVEFAPEDMTVTVETGITLAGLQRELAQRGQWLPIDPPNPDSITIEKVLSGNLSGPRRFAHGTIREHVIGLKAVMSDGRTIKSGGKVVKNVAGYDLARLFLSAAGTLGIVVEATFKLRPLPEAETFLATRLDLTNLRETIRALMESSLTPVVLDAHRLSANDGERTTLVLGLAGTRAEVQWQVELARRLGFSDETSLGYDTELRRTSPAIHRVAVLPSRLGETLATMAGRRFVARAGNGIVYHDGEPLPGAGASSSASDLARRLKAAFDPRGVFPELKP